ncbi:hypothetical protein [Nonomuraea sp. B5E05]|uniref:hypothetical protein n=1 Tax=Nonomuraea sp. B5E05 TaxID=3153569 RepID=UPI0032612A21
MVLRVSPRAGRVPWSDVVAVAGGALVAGALDVGAVVGGGADSFVGSTPHPAVASVSTALRARIR